MNMILRFLFLLIVPAAAAFALSEPPADSLYQLKLELVNQDGKNFALGERAGRPQLVSMFYTSCPYVCPLVIDTLKKTQNELSAAERARLDLLLVSFDPERDSAAKLKETFVQRKLDAATWTLARTDERSVRKLAAALGVQYRELENGEVNHSVALVLLDARGRIVAQTDKYGAIDPQFVDTLHKALAAH